MLREVQQGRVIQRFVRGRVRLAEQGVFVHAQRVIRQKMNIVDAELVGGEVGNGDQRPAEGGARLRGRFVSVKALDQRHADGDFFPGGGKALQVIQDSLSRTVRPLFEHLTVDVLQVGEEQIDVG